METLKRAMVLMVDLGVGELRSAAFARRLHLPDHHRRHRLAQTDALQSIRQNRRRPEGCRRPRCTTEPQRFRQGDLLAEVFAHRGHTINGQRKSDVGTNLVASLTNVAFWPTPSAFCVGASCASRLARQVETARASVHIQKAPLVIVHMPGMTAESRGD